MAIRLIVLGLRRSGTTIFMEMLRQDPRLRCYDEPLNPALHVLPGSFGIKLPDEFVGLLHRDPAEFWERFAVIDPTDELHRGLSDRQREWIEFLGASDERVIFDTTRCHFKLDALAPLAPGSVLVYLYRRPEANATSHLLPSGKRRAGWLRAAWRRRSFFTRTSGYDYWQFETVIGSLPGSRFALRLPEIGLDPERVYALPAVGRLMAYWRLCYERATTDGRRLWGDRFILVDFDEFCRAPRATFDRIHETIGLSSFDADFSRLHPPNRAFEADSPRWEELRRAVAMPELP